MRQVSKRADRVLCEKVICQKFRFLPCRRLFDINFQSSCVQRHQHNSIPYFLIRALPANHAWLRSLLPAQTHEHDPRALKRPACFGHLRVKASENTKGKLTCWRYCFYWGRRRGACRLHHHLFAVQGHHRWTLRILVLENLLEKYWVILHDWRVWWERGRFGNGWSIPVSQHHDDIWLRIRCGLLCWGQYSLCEKRDQTKILQNFRWEGDDIFRDDLLNDWSEDEVSNADHSCSFSSTSACNNVFSSEKGRKSWVFDQRDRNSNPSHFSCVQHLPKLNLRVLPHSLHHTAFS